MKKLNRKPSRRIWMIISDIIFLTGVIFGIFYDKLYIFILSRLLKGFAAGINTIIVPLYLREIVPDSVSGKFCGIFQIFINIGIIIGVIVSLPNIV